VEVPSGFHTPDAIPGNYVAEALAQLEIAVRADPGFIVFGVGADAGLSRVFDPALELRAAQAKANGAEIDLFN
jgi:hypothetical protein